MSKKESLFKRLKSASTILIPLVLSSMDRIEIVSNAMELRGFGKQKKRSWYMGHAFAISDILAMVVCGLLLIISIGGTFYYGTRFYNPFV